ncbi:unnamed protein product [Adineta ricciae]|uniref:Uncharacterized protein n=1 Tax=Adineta ricciae TaxID=249248 RepID=A0A816E8J6_ADIRI|nr:unnamed protein product [Adineta ricciae]
MAEKWLSDLPQSMYNTSDDILRLPLMSSVCTKRDWNINFRFDHLDIWNSSVLAAVLRPDDDSLAIFEQFVEERTRLNTQFHERFNFFTDSKTYTPHVSLGYFANEEGAQKALSSLHDWNTWFKSALQDSVLSFNHASLYGLTDMITFFKTDAC